AISSRRPPRDGAGTASHATCGNGMERSEPARLGPEASVNAQPLRDRRLPESNRPRVAMRVETRVPRDKPPAVLHRGSVDQAIGGVAGKRSRERDGGFGNARRDADGPELRGELFQPRPKRERNPDPAVCRQPCDLIPGDCCYCELISSRNRGCRRAAQAAWLSGLPMEDVR